MEGDTTVRVSRETWNRLKDRKEPGVSYDEIISGLLDDTESRSPDAEDTAQATN